ncbi:hypothetical protein [Nostoc sp.]|uniref:hypothetical protein n=1 Tax=Nostoc sp. TaxID=1180 RepID=UPI002FF49E21
MVYANVTMMDEYLPGMMSVIYGNVSPEEAIAKIEGSAVRSPVLLVALATAQRTKPIN